MMMLKSTQMIQNQMKMLLKLNLNSERNYKCIYFCKLPNLYVNKNFIKILIIL